jgi:hypothetical protein
VAWLGVTALTLGLVLPAFIVAFDRPELLGAPEVEALVARLAIPMQIVMTAALLVPMAAAATIAVFLFWRRSDDWMVLLFSLWILTNFAFSTRSLAALQQAYPAVQAPVRPGRVVRSRPPHRRTPRDCGSGFDRHGDLALSPVRH